MPALQFEIKALGRIIVRKMTTFGQAEMEALGLMEKKHRTSVKAGMTMWRIAEIVYMITSSAIYFPNTHPSVEVTHTTTNHPDMLTEKELEVTNLTPLAILRVTCRMSLRCFVH